MIVSPTSSISFRTAALSLLMLAPLGLANADPIAKVAPLAVSPRDVAEAPDDVFDEVASGLFVIGVDEKIYLEAHPEHGITLGGATWQLVGVPSGSAAALSAPDGTLVTLVPDVAGVYLVELTPLDESVQPTEPVVARVYAGKWVGAGVFNTHGTPDDTIPHCGNSCCHSESTVPRLNVVDDWLGTHHSNSLQEHLGGQNSAYFSTSCLPCHTLGFKETAVNGGFDDIADDIVYDLSNIPTLVADAFNNNVDNWPQLPAELQSHASIQCESCHGPGSNHMGNITEEDHGIGGVSLSPNACAQCHESERPGSGFYQWNTSTHPITAELSEGHVADSDTCRICHTGEGFVYGRVMNQPIPQLPTHDYSSVTCATCHDPHGSPNEHQLRVVGDFVLPSGVTVHDPGMGGTCVRCHNSRISDPEATASSSTRGAHYGTVGDMLAGAGAVDFGLPYVGNSAHSTIVEDLCVTCHMAESPEGGEELVGEHTYRMRAENPSKNGGDILNVENACGECHNELDTYDREARGDYDGDGTLEGIQAEVRGLLDVVQAAILANMTGTSVSSSTGKISISSGNFANLTPDQKRAMYNFNFVIVDGSLGIHNTSYTVQILQRSYYGATGHTILDDYPNMDLRGPVQVSMVPTPVPTPTPIPTATPIPTPVPEYLATVNLMGASPRDVALDQTGLIDEAATGLRNVGIGEKVYLHANKVDESVTGYTWSILSKPANSVATLSDTTGESITFRPDVKGAYLIRLTPQTTAKIIDVYDQRIYAAEWAGVGVFDTHADPNPIAPQCGTGFCHGGNNGDPDLNVLDQWLTSDHADKLQKHLRGENGDHYGTYCLECHTVGFNQNPLAVNNGFDDIASNLGYDLQNIVDLVADAATNNVDNFPQLPAGLQDHASIQCESCHGAGSLHPANLTASDKGIDGANLDVASCARCHESSRPGSGFYQWTNSSHPVTAELSEGHVAESDSCRVCHTGEGFIAARVNNEPIPQMPKEEYHGVTCSVCHDPHGSDEVHQLRVAGDFQLPSGAMAYGSGAGGICARCHNSRIDDPEVKALTSSRGAHHGPQSDVLLGSSGVSFGLPFADNSPHGVVVVDSCAHCHMAESPEGTDLVGGHTYAMRAEGAEKNGGDIINAVNACGSCHIGLDTYDYPAEGDYDGDGTIEGTQTEVAGLFDMLRAGILANYTGASDNDGNISMSSSNFNNLNDDQKRALYNFRMLWEDGSMGIHNTAYTVQLLQRSYFGVFGHPITDDYPDMYLRGPVQEIVDNAGEGWTIF